VRPARRKQTWRSRKPESSLRQSKNHTPVNARGFPTVQNHLCISPTTFSVFFVAWRRRSQSGHNRALSARTPAGRVCSAKKNIWAIAAGWEKDSSPRGIPRTFPARNRVATLHEVIMGWTTADVGQGGDSPRTNPEARRCTVKKPKKRTVKFLNFQASIDSRRGRRTFGFRLAKMQFK
jgi:hypothetical protein